MIHTEQQKALLDWWSVSHRNLPWRETRDPWAIMVSELMLQQTQVTRVIPKYMNFLERFPTPQECSQASPALIIEAWEGLGYNRRALNLHRAASIIVDSYGGVVPDSLDQLLQLPGIGPYTARAILCFAYEKDIGVVDVNTKRVISRIVGELLPPQELQKRADELVPQGQGWIWNQALMDLGSGICKARVVDCANCPLKKFCSWRGEGSDPVAYRNKPKRISIKFEGSDRQGRGRLINVLRKRLVVSSELEEVMGWKGDPKRCERVVSGLIKDGLVECNTKKEYSLPS